MGANQSSSRSSTVRRKRTMVLTGGALITTRTTRRGSSSTVLPGAGVVDEANAARNGLTQGSALHGGALVWCWAVGSEITAPVVEAQCAGAACW